MLATSILLSGAAIAAGSWVAWVFIVTLNVLLFTVLARIGLVAMIAAMFSVALLVAGLAIMSFRIATGAHAETARESR